MMRRFYKDVVYYNSNNSGGIRIRFKRDEKILRRLHRLKKKTRRKESN